MKWMNHHNASKQHAIPKYPLLQCFPGAGLVFDTLGIIAFDTFDNFDTSGAD